MITVNGNIVNEEKILQVKPYKVKDYFDYTSGWKYQEMLEITYETGIVSNIEASMEHYLEALKESESE
jgi:hypothetical protein